MPPMLSTRRRLAAPARTGRGGRPAPAARPGRRRRRRGCGSRPPRRCRVSSASSAGVVDLQRCSRSRRIRPADAAPSGRGAPMAVTASGARPRPRSSCGHDVGIDARQARCRPARRGAVRRRRGVLSASSSARSSAAKAAWRGRGPAAALAAVGEIDQHAVDAVERGAGHQADEELSHARDRAAQPRTAGLLADDWRCASVWATPSWAAGALRQLREAGPGGRRSAMPPSTTARSAADPACSPFDAELEVQVRAGGPAGRADGADGLALLDALAALATSMRLRCA